MMFGPMAHGLGFSGLSPPLGNEKAIPILRGTTKHVEARTPSSGEQRHKCVSVNVQTLPQRCLGRTRRPPLHEPVGIAHLTSLISPRMFPSESRKTVISTSRLRI